MNNHGFVIGNEQGIANLEQRKMRARVEKQPQIKTYCIFLNEEEEYLLKHKFECQTDADLQHALSEAIKRLTSQITRQEVREFCQSKEVKNGRE